MIFLQIPPAPTGQFKSDLFLFLAIAAVALVNLIQVLITEKRKTKEAHQQHAIEDALLNIERYLKILSNKYTEEVTDTQLPILIDEFTLHTKESIIRMASTSITKNEIVGNEREVLAKIDNFICNRFKDLVINLGRFKWHGSSMSEFVELSAKHEIIKNVQDIVVQDRRVPTDKEKAYATVISYLDQKFDQIRNSIKAKAYG